MISAVFTFQNVTNASYRAGLSKNMGLLNLAAKVWGQDSWDELTFNEKSFTVFIIFDLIVVSPFVILDTLDLLDLI